MEAQELYAEFVRMSREEQTKFLEMLRQMRDKIIAQGNKRAREANVEVSGLMKRLMEK